MTANRTSSTGRTAHRGGRAAADRPEERVLWDDDQVAFGPTSGYERDATTS